MEHDKAEIVEAEDVATVLDAMAELMTSFRNHDLALQDALSTIAAKAHSSREMSSLQHIDLLTQTHGDLGKLLPVLADALTGNTIDKDALRTKLTLRSLQDKLIDDGRADAHGATTPGDLSLF